MADIENFAPILIRNEAVVTAIKSGESNKDYFERAKKGGFSNDKDDSGGATMVGVTLATYKDYCKKKGLTTPDVAKLKAITYEAWKDIMKSNYWDKCRASEIVSQSVANIYVDWAFNSGVVTATKNIQQLSNSVVDGVIGRKTLAAINSKNALDFFNAIKIARYDFYDERCRKYPSQIKFRDGWYNRLNRFNFTT
jgi:lysozyme family protein